MIIKLVIFVIVCFLIKNSLQLNFDQNSCLKKQDKPSNGHKIVDQSFFSLDLSSSEYDIKSNKPLEVTIRTLQDGLSVTNVLMQAFSLQNDQTIGLWDTQIDSNFQLITCQRDKDTLISNDYGGEIIQLRLDQKEIGPDFDIFFRASIIGSDGKLVNIESKSVKLIDSKKIEQSQIIKNRSKRDVFDFFRSATELCGSRRSCYVSLNTCDVDPKTCNFVLSWEYDGKLVNFELTGLSKAWIAVVLSDDRYLGNDNIIVCSRYPDTERLSIDHYYKKKDDSVLYKIEPENYLKNKDISYNANEAYITCKFSRPKTVDNELVSDLSKPHYIYVERGAPGEMIVEKLNRLYQPSESQIEFASNIYIASSPRSWLVKVHAILGIIAWVFLGSIGILLARYYKPLWPNQVLNSFRVWFSFHRSIMIFVTLLSLLSLLFALIELNWSWSKDANDYLHSILGVIVIICSCINPILGFFRPSPTSYLRCLFFWCHWLVGVVAYCLAIPTIFIGMDLSKSDVPNWCSWLLFVWVIFHIIVEIILEVHYCCTFSQLQGNYSEKNTDYDKINKIPIKTKNPPGFRWKPSLLFVYSLVTALVVCALIIAIILLD